MPRTKNGTVSGLACVALCVSVVLVGCATSVVSTGTQRSGAEVVEPELPADLIQTLSRGGIDLAPSEDSGGLEPSEAIELLSKRKDLSKYEEPRSYAAIVESSDVDGLWPGRSVRIVHIPNVPQEVMPPDGPDGEGPSPIQVTTDLVAFFDAETGEHIVTQYTAESAIT
jgi:hypothetical protein